MASHIRVKICGLTTLNDAEAAVDCGADAVGFVFAESKRQMKPKQVWHIARNLPIFPLKVGVFMNEEVDKVIDVASYCNLDAVQLHGDESVQYCKKVAAHFKVIKTLKVEGRFNASLMEAYTKHQILLESACATGGSGVTWDWAKLPKKYRGGSIILSGGLTVANVRKAISIVHPMAVDVASGVESKPGIKNHQLIKKFIEQVKGIRL